MNKKICNNPVNGCPHESSTEVGLSGSNALVRRVNRYAIAKRACELFESEYMGQQQKDLWSWAVGKAIHEAENNGQI